jgi:hypothetical protein
MSTSIESLVAEYTKVKEDFIEKSKHAMRTAFKEFFETNPDIDQITWVQYTPHFNDGDACEFGVDDKYFTLAKDKVDLGNIDYPDEDDNCYGTYCWDRDSTKTDPIDNYRKAVSSFDKQISTLPEEIFLNSFGDHVKVIATKSGFDVQEYEHD